MLLALATLASAATVAVLDFDGYGVGFAQTQTATQAVRDAFLEEGLLDPLSGSDIAEGAARGQDAGLRRARELVAEGRRRCDGGDVAGAGTPLEEAIRLHGTARSDVGRRPELADAWYLLAVCLQKAGRAEDARAAFTEVAWLYPRYAGERVASPPTAVKDALRAAEDALVRAPRRIRSTAQVAEIGAALNVDFLVTGSLDAEGRMKTRLYAGDRLLGEAEATLGQLPALPVDDAYSSIAHAAASSAGAAPAPAEEEELDFAVSVPVLSTDEEAELDAELEGRPAADAPRAPSTTQAPRAPSTIPAPRARVDIRGDERGKVPTKSNQPQVTETWWFWTGAFLLVTGGAGGVAWAVYEPEPQVVEEPDGWTVRIATE